MKFLKYTFSFLIVFSLNSSCFLTQELPVEYDYSYRGRFEKYDTFNFLIQNDNANKSNVTFKEVVTNTIETHMNFLGYKRNQRKPDLLLSYSVFADTLKLRGYAQPNIEEWVKRPDRDLKYLKQDVNIDKGTLVIQIYDRKQNAAIWQGYATDKYNYVDFTDNRDVKNAVKSILNKYQFFSQDFIKLQKELKKQKRKSL